MATLQNKIDFAVVFTVKNANPNGDPLNGNRPRTNYDNLGEVTDVCLKRKMRDRLMEKHDIFVQSDDRKKDDATSLRDRAEKALGSAFNTPKMREEACKIWLDVRAFGQLFAYKGGGKKGKGKKNAEPGSEEGDESGSGSDSGVSIGIRGPVSVHSAFSVVPIDITSTQITKSVSGEGDGKKRASDTMGMKHRVDHGVYVFYGSMNPQLAERTGFSDADAEAIKKILPRMFENDASSARPEGSMAVKEVLWWKHDSKAGQYSSAKVHQTVKVDAQGNITETPLANLRAERIPGF
ncbi:MAG: type I CRISPR-associated protein Cas7 [Deltaproteobacteria bacterium]|nr:type I CRISPR-associated protein Cas7 [Deltaproteobacteria bacterium]